MTEHDHGSGGRDAGGGAAGKGKGKQQAKSPKVVRGGEHRKSRNTFIYCSTF